MNKHMLIITTAVSALVLSACTDDSPTQGRWTDGAMPSQAPVKTRWYSDAQVSRGAPLYQRYCASCHGPEAEATPNWRERDAKGYFPPPPLDGSAHAWHHPLRQLRQTIYRGGQALGGQMPGFGDQLKRQDIDAIIAWVQSRWSDDIYARWSEINNRGLR